MESTCCHGRRWMGLGASAPVGGCTVRWRNGGVHHKWDLPVLHYHKIMVIYPHLFLEIITYFFVGNIY